MEISVEISVLLFILESTNLEVTHHLLMKVTEHAASSNCKSLNEVF